MTEHSSVSKVRIVRFLKKGMCEIQDSVQPTHALLVGDQGTIAVLRSELAALRAEGIVSGDDENILIAKPRNAGSSQKKLNTRRTARPEPEYIELDSSETVAINPEESPLAKLYRRRDTDGSPFLSDDEFFAGERLRADFTRGSMMPSITTRWEMKTDRGSASSGSGFAEMTDIALASRIRVERALDAIGPELSGVMIDVCCFLKGLETVERERRWPARSAKMLLKTGLSILHRHYNPLTTRDRKTSHILHWGASDYRPSVYSR